MTRIDRSSLLLQQIATGDEKAFAELYHTTNRAIFNAVMLYVRDQHIAEELVQLTYIKLWNQRDRLSDITNPDNYLFILARNITLDHFRKVTVQARLREQWKQVSQQSIEDILQKLDERDVQKVLTAAINELSPQQQRAYLLASHDHMSNAEIAAVMNISTATVKRHLELSRRSIRQFVQKHLHFYLALGFWILK